MNKKQIDNIVKKAKKLAKTMSEDKLFKMIGKSVKKTKRKK